MHKAGISAVLLAVHTPCVLVDDGGDAGRCLYLQGKAKLRCTHIDYRTEHMLEGTFALRRLDQGMYTSPLHWCTFNGTMKLPQLIVTDTLFW